MDRGEGSPGGGPGAVGAATPDVRRRPEREQGAGGLCRGEHDGAVAVPGAARPAAVDGADARPREGRHHGPRSQLPRRESPGLRRVGPQGGLPRGHRHHHRAAAAHAGGRRDLSAVDGRRRLRRRARLQRLVRREHQAQDLQVAPRPARAPPRHHPARPLPRHRLALLAAVELLRRRLPRHLLPAGPLRRPWPPPRRPRPPPRRRALALQADRQLPLQRRLGPQLLGQGAL
mmetsp:Transcript_3163/g.9835  ORF Transcript_3163/g.9835 Transcript_3163/m.9835 type:complete len:231 (-) Transcript_3163:592-1284(-)